MTNDVLVFAEVRDGAFKPINRELVSAGTTLCESSGGVVHVAVIGSSVDAAVEEARSYATGKVFAATSPELDKYSTQGFASAMAAVIKEVDPTVVLFGATSMGKDLSARTAARLGGTLMMDCTELSLSDGALKATRPVYSGKAYAQVVSTNDVVKMATIRPNIYPPAQKQSNAAEMVKIDVAVAPDEITAKVEELIVTSSGRKDVTEAEIIVSGGRSLQSEENFGIIEELADTIGASVGASRAAVDAGYAPHSRQVGQTGKVVNPKLYIACGISGAIQHLVGMRTSKVIVALNKDANAPIYQYSDYGIVGDLFEIVPLLTKEFKALLGDS